MQHKAMATYSRPCEQKQNKKNRLMKTLINQYFLKTHHSMLISAAPVHTVRLDLELLQLLTKDFADVIQDPIR